MASAEASDVPLLAGGLDGLEVIPDRVLPGRLDALPEDPPVRVGVVDAGTVGEPGDGLARVLLQQVEVLPPVLVEQVMPHPRIGPPPRHRLLGLLAHHTSPGQRQGWLRYPRPPTPILSRPGEARLPRRLGRAMRRLDQSLDEEVLAPGH